MQRIHSHNDRNESQIEFVTDDRDKYATPDDFYAASIRLLWNGCDSPDNIERYIGNADKSDRATNDLRKIVAECLAITPVPDFAPKLDDILAVHSFRDDWNVSESVWCTDREYWLMSWGTSA